jgi:hypothetical protein
MSRSESRFDAEPRPSTQWREGLARAASVARCLALLYSIPGMLLLAALLLGWALPAVLIMAGLLFAQLPLYLLVRIVLGGEAIQGVEPRSLDRRR